MADEIKTLKSIQEELKKLNVQYANEKEQLRSLNEKYTPQTLANVPVSVRDSVTTTQASLASSVNKLASQMQKLEGDKEVSKTVGNIDGPDKGGMVTSFKDAFYDGLTKFFGVDYRAEYFRRLDSMANGFKDLKSDFQALGKALGLDKAKKMATGLFDFLKNAFIIGFSVVGIAKFLEGWSIADKWFGENATLGDRIASGLAKVLETFGFTDDAEITAKAISKEIESYKDWIENQIEIWRGMRNELTNDGGQVLLGLRQVIGKEEGGFLAGLGNIASGIGGIVSELVGSESIIAQAAGVALMFKIFKTIVTTASVLQKAGALVIPRLPVIAAITAGFIAIKGGFDALDKANKQFEEDMKDFNPDFEGQRSFKADMKYVGTILDGAVVSLGNAIVGLFGISPEQMDKFNKDTDKWLGEMWSGLKNAVNGLIGNIVGWFSNTSDEPNQALPEPMVAPEVQEANKRKVALAGIDLNKSGAIDQYSELLQAIVRSNDLSNEEKKSMLNSSREAAKAGTNFAQFVSGDTTVNQLVASFGPTPGSSAALTVNPSSLP